MLAKQHRLPHYIRLKDSRTLSYPNVLIKYAQNTLGHNRFGVVVSKRIDKRATVRNRMRRLLHQALYEQSPTLPQGFDVLCIVQKPFTSLSAGDLDRLSTQLSQ